MRSRILGLARPVRIDPSSSWVTDTAPRIFCSASRSVSGAVIGPCHPFEAARDEDYGSRAYSLTGGPCEPHSDLRSFSGAPVDQRADWLTQQGSPDVALLAAVERQAGEVGPP